MCGIAGYIARQGTQVDSARLTAMSDAVRHRGPDGEGGSVVGPVGLAHRRLSILDLSVEGAQPMMDPLSGRRIVFNGEIYNYLEIRDELSRLGRKFRTGTDTEVILAAYDEWGRDCVTRFNGMWAFALHDPLTDVVFCSRDRFGVKPFYFAALPNCFAFGSEIRQLLPLLPKIQPNGDVVLDFIFSNSCEHRDDTFFKSVRKLPAGSNLVYRIRQHDFSIVRYYRLQPRPELARISFDEAVNLYRLGLEDSIQLRLRSDVPVGTCLSGGLDSSSIAAIAALRHQSESSSPFSAVTAVSEDPSRDESQYAQRVADYSRLRWLTVTPDYDAFTSSLGDVVSAQEEPFAGLSIIMQFFVMKAAHSAGLKVLLDGQGGDETLLGYERYFSTHYATTLKYFGLRSMIASMRSSIQNNAHMSPWTIAAFYAYFSSPRIRHWNYLRRHRYLLQKPGFRDHLVQYAAASRDEFLLQRFEIETSNLPALLRYEDKNSMWHGVEARLPFLDYRLVELALSLPGTYKIRNGWTKYMLRQAVQDVLPTQIVWRRDKRGFEAPESIWLARHYSAMKAKTADSPLLAAFCDMERLLKSYDSLDGATRWRLYSLALWEERFGVSP